MKKILFITTSSLASNPRLVKEFECLKEDYECYVICFRHQDWSLSLSETIKLKNKDVNFIEINRQNSVFQTIKSKVLHKISIAINPVFKKSLKVCAYASNDKTPQLIDSIDNLRKRHTFDKVIAHNLGAFYPALQLSKHQNLDLQLDIEDFYPGEALYYNKNHEKENRMEIMSQSFIKATTITYASEGIKIECQKHFEVGNNTIEMTIINSFNSSDFIRPSFKSTDKLKCVWFSQHIGPNRGLEQVFDTAKKLQEVDFYLIGNKNKAYLDTIDLSDNVILHDIMKQEDLHDFLSNMDIGLALENAEADFNRNICLTNKFLAYSQSGLYVLATNTFGQSQFLDSLDYNAGEIMEGSLQESIVNLNPNLLTTDSRIERWQNAKLFAWENEQLKLKKLLQ